MSEEDAQPKRRMVRPPSGGTLEGRAKGHTAVKTAKRRTASSAKWLERQLNDPFVVRAKAEGWRSRAAFKLMEINSRYRILKPGARVVDLGCAPGGWLQVAVAAKAAHIVGIDLLPVDPVPGADCIEGDFTDRGIERALSDLIGSEGADVVLSDLAHNTTGHRQTDHLKIMALLDLAAEFACDHLRPGGHFVAKAFQGGTAQVLLDRLKSQFSEVRHFKPKSSRADSPEVYLVALGFKG